MRFGCLALALPADLAATALSPRLRRLSVQQNGFSMSIRTPSVLLCVIMLEGISLLLWLIDRAFAAAQRGYPLIEPAVKPLMNCFCRMKNKTTTGRIDSSVPAINTP